MSPPPLEFQAAVLGLVQGVCEFLPISSSAHLVVLPQLLGWPYLGKGFDVALHAGTLLALLGFFRLQLGELWVATQRLVFTAGRANDPDARLVKLLVVGSLPAAFAGFFLDGRLEPYLHGLLPVALFSILWGAALAWADSDRRPHFSGIDQLTPQLAFVIGCAQAAALLPGTSRSGVTITAALLLGLSRSEAARFSLLLSIPVVAGATLFKGWPWGELAATTSLRVVAIGVAVSAVVGALCLKRLLSYLQRGDFRRFAVYRVVFGCCLLGWLAWQTALA